MSLSIPPAIKSAGADGDKVHYNWPVLKFTSRLLSTVR